MERSLRNTKEASPFGYAVDLAQTARTAVGSGIKKASTLTEYIENTERANNAGVEVWLAYKGGRIHLPVAPFFDLNKTWGNQRVVLYEVGEVNVKAKENLRSTTLSSFFPHVGHDYYFLQNNYTEDPYDTCRKIEGWANEDDPIQLTITGTSVDLPVLIDGFTFGEDDSTRDVHFSLELSEYKYIEAPLSSEAVYNTPEGATTALTARPGSEEGLEKWEITYGDTLTGISSAVYGTPDKYQTIIDLNPWIANPDSLKDHEGEVLNLV